MGAVQYDHIHLCIHQSRHSLQHIGCDSHSGAAEQPSLLVLCRQGVFYGFLDVFDGDEAFQIEVLVHDRKLFLPGLCQNLLRLFQRDVLVGGDQPLAGHGFLDFLGEICLEFQVAVGDDAHQPAALGDGDAGDAELGHQRVCICQGMIGSQGKRICDDAVLRAFDLVHLFGLRLDGHVLMYDADAALSRHGDGHAVLRHSVHSCAHHRNVQFDLLRQPGAELHLVRHHL